MWVIVALIPGFASQEEAETFAERYELDVEPVTSLVIEVPEDDPSETKQ